MEPEHKKLQQETVPDSGVPPVPTENMSLTDQYFKSSTVSMDTVTALAQIGDTSALPQDFRTTYIPLERELRMISGADVATQFENGLLRLFVFPPGKFGKDSPKTVELQLSVPTLEDFLTGIDKKYPVSIAKPILSRDAYGEKCWALKPVSFHDPYPASGSIEAIQRTIAFIEGVVVGAKLALGHAPCPALTKDISAHPHLFHPSFSDLVIASSRLVNGSTMPHSHLSLKYFAPRESASSLGMKESSPDLGEAFTVEIFKFSNLRGRRLQAQVVLDMPTHSVRARLFSTPKKHGEWTHIAQPKSLHEQVQAALGIIRGMQAAWHKAKDTIRQ